jgi:hypothetical protein
LHQSVSDCRCPQLARRDTGQVALGPRWSCHSCDGLRSSAAQGFDFSEIQRIVTITLMGRLSWNSQSEFESVGFDRL